MTYRRVLAAVDESPAAAHAFRVADQIAAAAEADLVALRVVDEPWRFIEPGEVEVKRALRDNAWVQVAAAQVSDELRQLAVVEQIRTTRLATAVGFSAPSIEIARAAETEHADLIVLGQRHASRPERQPAGHTTDGTLQRARVPCLIVPFGQRTWRRVLVLSRDGAATGAILEQAFTFAGLFVCEVTVLEVQPHLALAGGGPTETLGRKAFALWARMPGTGAFDVISREGDPATEILRVAREELADLLVIGCSEPGAGETARIVEHAPCAVLTVPV